MNKYFFTAAVATALLVVPVSFAASNDASFLYSPECEATITEGEKNEDNMFGSDKIGDIDGILSPGNKHVDFDCTFPAKDPGTSETPALKPGEPFTLNLDLPNPGGQPITKASVWLTYDPKVLECKSVTMGSVLSLISPGMQDCYPEEGFVKMEASAESGSEPTDKLLRLASVVLTPLDGSNATSSPLNFYGIGKETNIYTLENGKEVSILDVDALGSLLVNMAKDAISNDSEDDSDNDGNSSDSNNVNDSGDDNGNGNSGGNSDDNGSESASSESSNGTSSNSSDSSNADDDNANENGPKENGASCAKDRECVSGICEQNICTEGTETMPKVTNSEWLSITPTRLRVTSEGTAAMLAWDPLAVAGVKGYNLYYGETSSKYLHRRTVAAKDNTHVLRGLPLGRTVYFALRALNASGDETGFSQEVSVTIGNPNSSSAPLVLNVGVTGADPAPSNPIATSPLQAGLTQQVGATTVPGETGLTSTMLWLTLIGAVAGTLFALRRQFS